MFAGINSLLDKALNYGKGFDLGGIIPSPRSTSASSSQNKGIGTKSDQLTLSEPLKALRDLGLDFEGSTFGSSAQMVNFNLQFTDEHIKGLTTNGSYDYQAQSLQVDFSFQSALTVKDASTGEEHQEYFQFDFHMTASQVQTTQGNQKMEKEDILQFARKILNKISKLHSEGKQVDGMVLDDEDMKELGSVDKGRLLSSIMQVVNLLRSADPMRGNNGDHVLLKPERDQSSTAESSQQQEQNISISLSVKQISFETTQTGSTEAPPASEPEVQTVPL